MKRYLLFLLMCVCASVGAWAEVSISHTGDDWTVTVHSGDDPNLTNVNFTAFQNQTISSLKVVTEQGASVTGEGIAYMLKNGPYAYQAIGTLDLSDANLTNSLVSFEQQYDNYTRVESLIMPKGGELPSESLLSKGSKLNIRDGSAILKYVIVPSSDGEDVLLYLPAGNNSSSPLYSEQTISNSFIDNAKAVEIRYESTITSRNTELENYIYTTLGKAVAFDGIVTDIVGGSVKTGVATALDGKADSKVKNLTITSGILTSGGDDTDVEYINSLTGLQTLDISAATATADQIFDLLSSNATTITLSDAQKELLKTVSGKTFTAEMLAKVGLTPSQLANGMTNTNYFVDGSTLIVTGEINSTVEGRIRDLVSEKSITKLDVSNATNTSEYTIAEISAIKTVSLPGSGNVKYGGTAIQLVNGVLEVNIPTDYASIQNMLANSDMKSVLPEVEHLKITGTLSDDDLSKILSIGTTYKNIETLDLSTVANKPFDISKINTLRDDNQMAVLLPTGTNIAGGNNGTYPNCGANLFALDNNGILNILVNSAGNLPNGGYFIEQTRATMMKAYNGISGSGSAGATALNAYSDYTGIQVVDLTDARSNNSSTELDQTALANLSSAKTVLSPVSPNATTLVITGPLTDAVLGSINRIKNDHISAIDFSGATIAEGTSIDWSSLTGPTTSSDATQIKYVLLPSSESDKVATLTGLNSLKAAGAMDGTKAALHVYAEETDSDKGATHEFATTFNSPFTSATRLVLSNDADATLNTVSSDLSTGVVGSSVSCVDLRGAVIATPSSLTFPSSLPDVITPNGLSAAEMEPYLSIQNVKNAYSHDGDVLNFLFHGYGVQSATSGSAAQEYLEGASTFAFLTTPTYRIWGTAIACFNDLNVETIDLTQAEQDGNGGVTLANTHIKNLLASGYKQVYKNETVGTIDIHGCTSLEKADFSGVHLTKLIATNMPNLAKLYVNNTEYGVADGSISAHTASADATDNGYVNISRTTGEKSGDYSNLTVFAQEDYKWERIIPSLSNIADETKKYNTSNEGGKAFNYQDSYMVLHEAEADDKYVYWHAIPTNSSIGKEVMSPDGEVIITMPTNNRLALSSILEQLDDKRYTKVTINGPITQADVAAFSGINADILDLSGATMQRSTTVGEETTYTDDMTILQSSSEINDNVKFVVLPPTTTRDDLSLTYDATTETVKSTLLQGFTGLYTALAYNDNTMVTYVKVEGTLQPAVVAAGKSSLSAAFTPAKLPSGQQTYVPNLASLKNLYLSGNVNAYDVVGTQELDKDGHLRWDREHTEISGQSPSVDPRQIDGGEGGITAYGGLSGAGVTMLDMKYASFENIKDMTVSFWNSTYGQGMQKVVISEMPTVTELPADFFNVANPIWAWCIPSNIEILRSRAFQTCDYVWTTPAVGSNGQYTDPEGGNTKLDNGIYKTEADYDAGIMTYGTDWENTKEDIETFVRTGDRPYMGSFTFGSNIKLIETGVFSDTQCRCTDVYVLNTEAPECHVDAFNLVMYVNNGGFNSTTVGDIIERKNYVPMAMLHYPRQTTTPNLQRYTDPTRVYSIATGLRDGRGAVIYFPTRPEFLRAYIQGTYGYTWNAWDPTRVGGSVNNPSIDATSWKAEDQLNANAGWTNNDGVTADVKQWCTFYDVTLGGATKPTGLQDYDEIYWTGSANASSGSESEHLYPTGKDYRGWHQFVLTAYAANTVLEEEPYRSYITDNDWWTICPTVDITREDAIKLFGATGRETGSGQDMVPYVSKLRYVRRNYSNTTITLNFSKNLMVYKEARTEASDLLPGLTQNQHGSRDESGVLVVGTGEAGTGMPDNNNVVMSAGVPYLIKPNLPVGAKRQFRIFKDEQEAQKLRAQYEAANKELDVNIIVSPGLYERMNTFKNLTGEQQIALVESGKYTVPVFVSGNRDDVVMESLVMNGDSPKEYTIAASPYHKSADWYYTFVGTFYQSFMPGNAYLLGWNADKGKAQFFYNDKPDTNVMRWVNGSGIICPTKEPFTMTITKAIVNGNDMQPAQWKITGLPDDSFVGVTGSRSSDLLFDAPDVIAVDGTTTIGGVDLSGDTSVKVYGLDGQQKSSSLQNLPKGVYVVNGKKYIVK